jgi:hypothetical protein
MYTVILKRFKIKVMLQNRKNSTGLLLAGLAAFAYYKYSKMSEEEKQNLVASLKDQEKKLFDQYVPEEIKNVFATKGNTSGNNNFGQGSGYTSNQMLFIFDTKNGLHSSLF